MAAESDLDPRVVAVNLALREWRQGDCVLEEQSGSCRGVSKKNTIEILSRVECFVR